MKTIIILLCLGLMGCATTPKVTKSSPPPQPVKKLHSVTVSPKEADRIIAVFDEAIKNNPKYAGAYYNRAIAYYYKKDYKKSWQDVHTAEALGSTFKPSFIQELKKASGMNK